MSNMTVGFPLGLIWFACTDAVRSPCPSYFIQGLVEVLDDVIGVFTAHA